MNKLTFVLAVSTLAGGWMCRAQIQPNWQQITSFQQAIQANDTNRASDLLESNTNLALAHDFTGKQPLLEAAEAGNIPLIRRMIALGADINATGDTMMSSGSQRTALHVAIWRNRPDVCKFLLDAGADPNKMAFGYETPLHLAFKEGREVIAACLMDHGADPFLCKFYVNDHTTPFELAIARTSGKLVPRMLDGVKPAEIMTKSKAASRMARTYNYRLPTWDEFLQEKGATLLMTAAQRGELEAVQALFKAGVRLKEPDNSCPSLIQSVSLAANEAARNQPGAIAQLRETRERLKALDGSQADSSYIEQLSAQETRLAETVEMLSPEHWQKMLQVLMQQGASYDAFAAAALGDTNRISKLLAGSPLVAGARDCDGQTTLHWAVKTDRLPMLVFWIAARTPLDATNNAGQTALHQAAAAGKADFVRVLLEAQASTAIQDTNGWTALDVANKNQRAGCIHLLLPKTPGAHDERGLSSLLHKVAASGNTSSLAALLENQTGLEARNELGLTPLAVAVQGGHLAAAALLVDKGADVNARDPAGNTLLQQILLQDQFTVRGFPPASWFDQAGNESRRAACPANLIASQEGRAPNPVLQGAGFLLACGVNVRATNHAGQTVMQMVMDDKLGHGVFFFDDDLDKLLQLLARAGGNLNQRDAEGNTVLHRLSNAFDANDVERFASLVKAGADINATNNLGETPLHKAAESLSSWSQNDPPTEPFRWLLFYKANVNARDHQGRTPLDVLATSDSMFKAEATRALIDAGADLNKKDARSQKDVHGRAAVHLALSGKWPWSGAGEQLALLVQAGADLNARDDEGKTPLHYLAAMGDDDPMFFIHGIGSVFSGTNIHFSARDNNGDTPLHIAARTDTRDVFDWLLTHGAGLDDTNNAGETPRLISARKPNAFRHFGPQNAQTDIFAAARQGNLDALSALIKADPGLVDAAGPGGQRPLFVAIVAKQTNAAVFLAQHGARWDVITAVLAGNAKALDGILKKQPDEIGKKFRGSSLLHLAATRGDIEAVKILLAAKADLQAVDSRGLSSLGIARLLGQKDVEQVLREHGAAENIFDAAYAGDCGVATALVRSDKSLATRTNPRGIPVVAVAAGTGNEELLRLLLGQGASATDVDRQNGWTLLHFAAAYNQTNAARWLLSKGAKTDVFDTNGFTPLHLASLKGSAEMVSLLLKRKANVNLAMRESQDDTQSGTIPWLARGRSVIPGKTALHVAAAACQTNVIPLLLAAGAKVNATDAWGRTPLDQNSVQSIMRGRFMVVQTIIELDSLGIEELGLKESFVLVFAKLIDSRRTATISFLEQAGGKYGTSSVLPGRAW